MPTFIRVEDRDTGHQYDVDERAFDPELHKKVNAPSRWPDLSGDGALPRPALVRTDLAGQPADTEES